MSGEGGGGGEDRGLKTFHRLRAVSYFFLSHGDQEHA